MEAFVALGLASNIVQFVDFSWKLFAESLDIYRSAAGASSTTRTLAAIGDDVSRLSEAITVSQYDKKLAAMAEECRSIAHELSTALDKLKAKGQQSVWASFSVALKGVLKKSKIDDICDRLAKVQAQLSVHLQFLVLYAASVPSVHRTPG